MSKKHFRRKARKEAHNNREYILYSRIASGDCLFCGRHDGENIHGGYSEWGKKKAMKHYYATGQGRKLPKNINKYSWYLGKGLYDFPKENDEWREAYKVRDWEAISKIDATQNFRRWKLGYRALLEERYTPVTKYAT